MSRGAPRVVEILLPPRRRGCFMEHHTWSTSGHRGQNTQSHVCTRKKFFTCPQPKRSTAPIYRIIAYCLSNSPPLVPRPNFLFHTPGHGNQPPPTPTNPNSLQTPSSHLCFPVRLTEWASWVSLQTLYYKHACSVICLQANHQPW